MKLTVSHHRSYFTSAASVKNTIHNDLDAFVEKGLITVIYNSDKVLSERHIHTIECANIRALSKDIGYDLRGDRLERAELAIKETLNSISPSKGLEGYLDDVCTSILSEWKSGKQLSKGFTTNSIDVLCKIIVLTTELEYFPPNASQNHAACNNHFSLEDRDSVLFKQIFNFSAGPCLLPKQVYDTSASEMHNWHETGISVMEMSHRSPEFVSISEKAKDDLRQFLQIPTNFKVFFFQGGASLQYAAIIKKDACFKLQTIIFSCFILEHKVE